MCKKSTVEEILCLLEKNKQNYTFPYIEDEYKNRRSKITYVCEHGHIKKCRLSELLNKKTECKKCWSIKQSKSLDLVREQLNNIRPNYEFPNLEEEYDYSNRSYITYICENGHKNKTQLKELLRGKGCPNCAAERTLKGYNEEIYFEPFLFNLLGDEIILQQYKVEIDINNMRYIDFYLPSINLAIEYDEDKHFRPKNKEKDIIRENEIKNVIGCDFIRIYDREFMKNNEYASDKLKKYIKERIDNIKTKI